LASPNLDVKLHGSTARQQLDVTIDETGYRLNVTQDRLNAHRVGV
jgi:hypothetical protein